MAYLIRKKRCTDTIVVFPQPGIPCNQSNEDVRLPYHRLNSRWFRTGLQLLTPWNGSRCLWWSWYGSGEIHSRILLRLASIAESGEALEVRIGNSLIKVASISVTFLSVVQAMSLKSRNELLSLVKASITDKRFPLLPPSWLDLVSLPVGRDLRLSPSDEELDLSLNSCCSRSSVSYVSSEIQAKDLAYVWTHVSRYPQRRIRFLLMIHSSMH